MCARADSRLKRKGKSDDLTHSQMMALAIAAHVRNEMERLHSKITDELMAEINVSIRYAIHDFFENHANSEVRLLWLAMSIPPYWEVPGRDPRPELTGEQLIFGKPVSPEMIEDLNRRKAEHESAASNDTPQ